VSGLQVHVDDYLRLRRALGFKLEREGRLLPQLVAYLEAAGAKTVGSEVAISWARLPAGASPNYWAKRLSIARGFAASCTRSTRRPRSRRRMCFAFVASARPPTCGPGRTSAGCWSRRGACAIRLRAASYEALFGLLAVSGMRVGEAIALGREDVDLDAGVITIRKAKLDRVRLVPLHPTRVSDIPCKRFW
jgi:integrase/recombinase XerD